MSKVTQILSTKSGISKTNKPYTVTTLQLDDGKQAETLQTVKIGDEGEAVWNSQFNKFDFKRASYTANGSQSSPRVFKQDPEKQESIEKQSTLQRATELVVASGDGQKLADKVAAVKSTYDELYHYVFRNDRSNNDQNEFFPDEL